MEIKEMVNPDNYKNLEMTFNIIKYPHLKSVAGRVSRVLTHCQRALDPSETELHALLQDTKVQTAEFMGFVADKVLVGTDYRAAELVTAQTPLSYRMNSHYRKMTREELFQSAFDTMGVMKDCVTKEMGVLRHPAELKRNQISINASEYIAEYQKMFASMDNIYTYFEPTIEDTQDKTL